MSHNLWLEARESTFDNSCPHGLRCGPEAGSGLWESYSQRSGGCFTVAQSFSKARFLTVQEVADLMRVSSMTVYRLIKSGDLPAVRVGRSFRVSDTDIDAYLAARYTQAG